MLNALKKLNATTRGVGAQMKSLATGINQIKIASKALNDVDFSELTTGVQQLAKALQPLSGFKTQASGLIVALSGVGNAIDSLNKIDDSEFIDFGKQIETLTEKMKPLNEISGRLGATLRALSSLSGVADTLRTFDESLSDSGKNGSIDTRFDAFAKDIERLKQALVPLGDVKSRVGSLINTLSRFTQVSNALESTNFTSFSRNIQLLASSLKPLNDISSTAGRTINALKKIPEVANGLNSVDFTKFSNSVRLLCKSIEPLKNVDTAGFNKTINALNRISTVSEKVANTDFIKLKTGTRSLISALKPLQTQANGCVKAFSLFGPRIHSAASGMRILSKNTGKADIGISNLSKSISASIAKFGILWIATRRVASVFSKFVIESNAYVENLNLFTVSMGKAAEEAQNFAEVVSNKLGLDPSAFMRYQGVLQQITTGFGVASERASIMSKNLTQIGYDISSFFNIGIEDSMAKVQSGIAGELEPLRRLGYALDEATLQQVAYNHGIDMSIRKMTQAQKSQIRYLAIMEQSNNVMGDMARTIITPANSVRVLQQQVTLLSRAIGNMLVPMLSKMIPYLIAIIKYATEAANRLALLMGFKIPEIDYGDGLSAGAETSEDLADGFNDITNATDDAAKALQRYLAPFDEINKPSSSVNGSDKESGSITGDFDIKLPEYDFLKGFQEQADVAFGHVFDVFKRAWDEKGQEVLNAVKRTFNELNALCKAVGRSFSEIWNDGTGLRLVKSFLKTLTLVFDTVGDIAAAFRLAWNENARGTQFVKMLLMSFLELFRVINAVGDSFRSIWNIGIGQEVMARLIELATTMLSIVANIASAFQVAWLSNNLGASLLGSIANLCENIFYFANNIAQTFLKVWTNGTGIRLFEKILRILKTIVDTIDMMVLKFNEVWLESGNGEKILQTLANAFENLLIFIKFVCDSAYEFWSTMGSAFAQNVVNGIQALADGLEHLTQKFVEVWQNGGDRFFQSLAQLVGKVIELAGVITGQLVSSLGDSLAPLLSSLMSVLANVFDAISRFIDWLLTDGRPVLDALVEVLKNVLLAWAAWKGIKAIISPIVGLVKTLMGTASKIMHYGEILTDLGFSFSSVGKIVGGLAGIFKSAFGVMKTAFTGLLTAIVAHPVIAVIVAIAGAIIYLWNTNEDFRNAVIEIWNSILGIIQDVWGGICALFTGDSEGLVEHATNLFNRLPGPIKGALSTVGTVMSETWGGMCALFTGDTDGMIEHTKNAFGALPQPIQEFLMGAATWINDKLIEIIGSVRNLGQSIADGWSWIWTSINTFCQNIWQSITTIWNNIWLTLSTICQNIWNGVVGIWTNILSTIGSVCQGIWAFVGNVWSNIWNKISTVCQNVWNFIGVAWNNISEIISTISNSIWENLSNIWNNIWSTLSTIGQNIWNTLSNVWNSIWSFLSGIFNNILNTAISSWNNISSTVTNICEMMKNWIVDKWNFIKDSVIGKAREIYDSVVGAFNNLYDSVVGTVKGLYEKVVGWWDSLREKLSQPIKGVISFFQGSSDTQTTTSGTSKRQPSSSGFAKLKGFASGGFPTTGQLFYARENGIPEMVGTVGGKSAVANNTQIEDAISVAVYKAVLSAMQSAGGSTNGQPMQITVNVGEDTLVNKIIKGINDESRRQGQVLINV